ncbi:MAG TPA: hypothetical protein VNI02_22815 [Blastocatellia bacterium]|nr:hypothetical protein [Blastocatellia bacterium]
MLTQGQIVDLVIDALLVFGFGIQHSIIATIRLKKVVQKLTNLDPVSWRGIQSIVNVSYIVLAACLWREVPIIVWDLTGTIFYWVFGVILVVSWIWYFQIHLFEYDCGQAFGSSAVLSRLQGSAVPPMEMWKVGTRRWLRFPVHTAFFPMFFAFPRMSLSMLVLAIVANFNNVYGTILYDKRLERLIGKAYKTYQERTGLLFFPLRKAPKGAADLNFPSPAHWNQPLQNMPGVITGLFGGYFYWSALGVTSLTTSDTLKSWGASALVSVFAGIIIGLVFNFQSRMLQQLSYPRLLTLLSTNSALASAISIITWWFMSFFSQGTLPILYVSFAMWMTVLWVGHALAFYTLYALHSSLVKGLFTEGGAQRVPLKVSGMNS